ncbi:MAG: hypothetical protein IKH13_05605 [Clostridia bacterium]|nr:hypothetical protein [Clostridia bacterium]
MSNAYERAAIKLKRIIAREGDADGARLKPAYFLQLLQEEIQLEECERFFRAMREGDKKPTI